MRNRPGVSEKSGGYRFAEGAREQLSPEIMDEDKSCIRPALSASDKPALLRSPVRLSIVACVLVHIAPALKQRSVTCDRMDRDNRLSKNL